MPNKSALKVEMNTLDDLFKLNKISSLQTDSVKIPLTEIDNFPDHPFKVVNDEAMQELVKSIRENGMIMPAIVRKKEDGRYELISGHRRKMACELAGISSMAVIERNLDKETATITMVDSNMQRESILPSEKAFAYKMRLEAMNRQGERTDLTCVPSEHKLENQKSREILAVKMGESSAQIRRYIRLTELIPELLEMVDNKTFGFQPAVEISNLTKEQQRFLLETIESEERTPSLSQAQRMKQLNADGRLNLDVIFAIMTEVKPNQKEKVSFKTENFRRYFPKEYTTEQMEDTIMHLLEEWQSQKNIDMDAR
jgi:ParB family chromosome partitioning protein